VKIKWLFIQQSYWLNYYFKILYVSCAFLGKSKCKLWTWNYIIRSDLHTQRWWMLTNANLPLYMEVNANLPLRWWLMPTYSRAKVNANLPLRWRLMSICQQVRCGSNANLSLWIRLRKCGLVLSRKIGKHFELYKIDMERVGWKSYGLF